MYPKPRPAGVSRFDDVSFGSSGIRGRFGDEITPELALRIGRALAGTTDSVVLARDARTTGPTIENALVSGITAGGATVDRMGVAPTPALAHAVREGERGVMVTASHNPAPDTGFKLFTPGGASLGANDRNRLLALIRDPPMDETWEDVGEVRQAPGRVDDYVDAVLKVSGPLEARPRVVVDTGNGAASDVAPRILREAGASVLTLNATPDGTFPGRPSEPTPENIADLAAVTAATDAICGFAHDGDGDRIVAVDEDGRVLNGDQVIVLLAQAMHVGSIAVPVDTSSLVWDALPDVDVEVTPVGDAYVSQRLKETMGDLGGEPSGAVILPETSLCPDGPHAALILARLAARHGGLGDLVDDLPAYATLRESVECPEPAKQTAMARISDKLNELGEIETQDGVRMETDDGWALVRPSGTEPKLRITAEASTEPEAERLMTLVRGIVNESLHEVAQRG